MKTWGFQITHKNLISGIDDRLGGKTYRRFFAPQAVGDVLKFGLNHTQADSRGVADGDRSDVHVRILAPVHHNTVRALLRQSQYILQKLDSGHWYEVMSD